MAKQRQQPHLPLFDEHFLDVHAGRVISDPEISVAELVANCWDAGADNVKIEWPQPEGGTVSVSDDGIGMTSDEFLLRWRTLSWNRRAEKDGDRVKFPEGHRPCKRVAFGRNGIGRHAMFHFASHYEVITTKGGKQLHARVARALGGGETPFDVNIVAETTVAPDAHGTTLKAVTGAISVTADQICDAIGSRFVVDPDFKIFVNGFPVTFVDLEHLSETTRVEVPGLGEVLIRRFDTARVHRHSKYNGIAWWVNRRLVGTPSWEGLTERLIDARRGTAKRYTYVVEADLLESDVKKDWTGFRVTPAVTEVQQAVEEAILADLRTLTKDTRRERKIAAFEQNKGAIAALPVISQDQVAAFAEEIQIHCPSMSERDLSNAVQLLTGLEKARSGYSLMEKLAQLPPDDLDGLNGILDEWTVSDAKKVLSELRFRLDLIKQLEKLTDKAHADELHELQPLFERGLWIFGPEFESISFTSNLTLATVVKKHFGDTVLRHPDRRPDFVVLPDTSIGVYSRDAYDERHEVCGYGAIVIVELKKGGHTISHDEKDQAMGYIRELRRSGKVTKSTPIVAYVLGSQVDPEAEAESREGESKITARPYSVQLRQAHARTFHLMRKLEAGKPTTKDQDLQSVLKVEAMPLFDRDAPTAP